MKKSRFVALAIAAALGIKGVQAAPYDHEFLRVHPDELIATGANVDTLGQIFGAIFAQDWDAMAALYADNYVQHNPDMMDRKEGVIELFKALDYASLVYQPVLQIAEGPYVVAMSKLQFAPDQPMLGAVDINFIRDGQSREHWDIIMPVEDVDKFFGVSRESVPTDQATVEANKDMVAKFLNTVFNLGEVDRIPEFVAEQYVQHGAGENGRGAVIDDARTRFAGAEVDIKRIIGQNDLVLAHTRVTAGSRDFSRVDIWRVTDGMLSEHWGIMQPVPHEQRHPNGMF